MEFLDITVVVVIGIAVIAWTCWSGIFKRRYREKYTLEGLSEERRKIVHEIPLCRRLPDDLKEKLYGKIAIFLHEKEFDGCDGQEITEEVRVTVAALACLLILNNETDFYPKLRTVVVHPHAYCADHQVLIGGQVVEEEDVVKLGESWGSGSLVLSWTDTLADARRQHGRHNVVLHEFAHQLDQLDGVANGTPTLASKEDYERWEQVMAQEFQKLQRKVKNREYHVIDEYGAENRVEFFAVVTESFFCSPAIVRETHPDMYRELAKYYKLDPQEWEAAEPAHAINTEPAA
jgi:hypothetical protein